MNEASTTIFSCDFCKSDIEADSFFCDQCGKEIFLCEKCNQPGRQGFCEEDGEPLFAAKDRRSDAVPHALQSAVSGAVTQRIPDPVTSAPFVETLQLVNSALGILIDIQHDAIFGRTAGPYTGQLGKLMTISGKHLLFRYEASEGWTFQDIGSTHGTKYSKTNKAWHTESKTAPHTPISLQNKAYLLVANVEFSINIERTTSTEGL